MLNNYSQTWHSKGQSWITFIFSPDVLLVCPSWQMMAVILTESNWSSEFITLSSYKKLLSFRLQTNPYFVLSFTLFPSATHHHRNVEDMHLFLDDLWGLLERGCSGLGQLPRGAHGNVEVQCAILQPLLPPVNQRNVRGCARHLCKRGAEGLGKYMAGFCAPEAKLLHTGTNSEAFYFAKMFFLIPPMVQESALPL